MTSQRQLLFCFMNFKKYFCTYWQTVKMLNLMISALLCTLFMDKIEGNPKDLDVEIFNPFMEKMRFNPTEDDFHELVPGKTFECQLAGYPEPIIYWEVENLHIFPDNNDFEQKYFIDRVINQYFAGSRLTVIYEPELCNRETKLYCIAEGKYRQVVEWKVRTGEYGFLCKDDSKPEDSWYSPWYVMKIGIYYGLLAALYIFLIKILMWCRYQRARVVLGRWDDRWAMEDRAEKLSDGDDDYGSDEGDQKSEDKHPNDITVVV